MVEYSYLWHSASIVDLWSNILCLSSLHVVLLLLLLLLHPFDGLFPGGSLRKYYPAENS